MVVLINTFHYFLQEGYPIEIMKPIRAALDQYTAIHFRTEETLMEKTEYPGLEEHIILHKKLTGAIEETARKIRVSRDPDEALAFLKEWWLDHINKADREFSLHVKMTE